MPLDYSKWDNLDTGSDDSDSDDDGGRAQRQAAAAKAKAAVSQGLARAGDASQRALRAQARPLSALFDVRRAAGNMLIALAPRARGGSAGDAAPQHAREAMGAAARELRGSGGAAAEQEVLLVGLAPRAALAAPGADMSPASFQLVPLVELPLEAPAELAENCVALGATVPPPPQETCLRFWALPRGTAEALGVAPMRGGAGAAAEAAPGVAPAAAAAHAASDVGAMLTQAAELERQEEWGPMEGLLRHALERTAERLRSAAPGGAAAAELAAQRATAHAAMQRAALELLRRADMVGATGGDAGAAFPFYMHLVDMLDACHTPGAFDAVLGAEAAAASGRAPAAATVVDPGLVAWRLLMVAFNKQAVAQLAAAQGGAQKVSNSQLAELRENAAAAKGALERLSALMARVHGASALAPEAGWKLGADRWGGDADAARKAAAAAEHASSPPPHPVLGTLLVVRVLLSQTESAAAGGSDADAGGADAGAAEVVGAGAERLAAQRRWWRVRQHELRLLHLALAARRCTPASGAAGAHPRAPSAAAAGGLQRCARVLRAALASGLLRGGEGESEGDGSAGGAPAPSVDEAAREAQALESHVKRRQVELAQRRGKSGGVAHSAAAAAAAAAEALRPWWAELDDVLQASLSHMLHPCLRRWRLGAAGAGSGGAAAPGAAQADLSADLVTGLSKLDPAFGAAVSADSGLMSRLAGRMDAARAEGGGIGQLDPETAKVAAAAIAQARADQQQQQQQQQQPAAAAAAAVPAPLAAPPPPPPPPADGPADGHVWSAAQQRALDAALRQNPPAAAGDKGAHRARWRAIGTAVEGKTARQCALRWKRVRAAMLQALDRKEQTAEAEAKADAKAQAKAAKLAAAAAGGAPRIADLSPDERAVAHERLQALRELAGSTHTQALEMAQRMQEDEEAAAADQEEEDDAWWNGDTSSS